MICHRIGDESGRSYTPRRAWKAAVDRIVRLRHIPRDPRHASKTDTVRLKDRLGKRRMRPVE